MNKASLSTKTTTSRATPKVKAVRKAAPKAEKAAEAESAPAPAPVQAEAAPVETPAAQESESPSFRQRLETLIQAQQSHMLVLKAQVQELRKLQREHDQLVKDASRKNKKKKAST